MAITAQDIIDEVSRLSGSSNHQTMRRLDTTAHLVAVISLLADRSGGGTVGGSNGLTETQLDASALAADVHSILQELVNARALDDEWVQDSSPVPVKMIRRASVDQTTGTVTVSFVDGSSAQNAVTPVLPVTPIASPRAPLTPVTYRLNGGTVDLTGYLDELVTPAALYSDILRQSAVVIGSGTAEALGTSIKASIPAVSAPTAVPSISTTLRPVVYKTVGGSGFVLGYLEDTATGQALYSSLTRATAITIGTAVGNAIAASIELARKYLIRTDSFPIAHSLALLPAFTQPSEGSSVSVSATLQTGVGSQSQFDVGASVVIANVAGDRVAGNYIVRANAWPTIQIELQSQSRLELGAGQTVYAPGASIPAGAAMVAISRVTPPTGATSALLSVARPTAAISSAISGANSSTPATLQQSRRDQAQVNYPSVTINFAPATLAWDAGPKNWVEDSAELGPEELTAWIYAYADEGRTAHATIRWMGGPV